MDATPTTPTVDLARLLPTRVTWTTPEPDAFAADLDALRELALRLRRAGYREQEGSAGEALLLLYALLHADWCGAVAWRTSAARNALRCVVERTAEKASTAGVAQPGQSVSVQPTTA
jgi:hypothetical protein